MTTTFKVNDRVTCSDPNTSVVRRGIITALIRGNAATIQYDEGNLSTWSLDCLKLDDNVTSLQINCTPAEARLIIAALETVAPAGGGSTQYHLAERIATDLNLFDDNTDLCGELATNVVHDYLEMTAS